MKNLDLQYICTVIGNLSGMPVRIYDKNRLIFYQPFVNLPKDPVCLYETDLFDIKDNIGYYITPTFYFFGIINHRNYKIILGPTRQLPAIDRDLRELAFRLNLLNESADEFVSAMKSIVTMPLESLMQILCVINYILNKEKTELKSIQIYETKQAEIKRQFEDEKTNRIFDENNDEHKQKELHNTLAIEQTLMNIVRKGDSAALRKWIKNAPAVRSGILAGNQLRQQKNIFIVTTTLVSRNAIRGGMEVDDALSLSDSYILKCELHNNIIDLTNLQYRMIMDFTERVEKIRFGKNPSGLVIDVSNYIQRHLSDAIKTKDVAANLFISRSRLSTKFKEESGIKLSDFITAQKIEEAKRLLLYSDKNINTIGSFLGFASQSHFSLVFKKHTGKTPGEYREMHNK